MVITIENIIAYKCKWPALVYLKYRLPIDLRIPWWPDILRAMILKYQAQRGVGQDGPMRRDKMWRKFIFFYDIHI